ncbi:MAG: FAD-dependent oxidoreductase [Pontixanthobacter sp.]
MRICESIVIGAGIAGLSAAARCAQHGEVIVLEAEKMPGMHSSGRSVAFLHFGIGDVLIRSLTMLSREPLRAAVKDDRAPPAITHPALFIARANETGQFNALEAVLRRFTPGHQRLSAEEAQALVPALKIGADGFTGALLDPDALSLDADAMLQGHVRDLRAAGGELVCDAPVTVIKRSGDHWIVETPPGIFQAKRVINAAGAWADKIAEMAGVTPIGIRPLRRTIISFAAPEGQNVIDWPFTKTIGPGFYMRPEGSSRLLASALDETLMEPCDAVTDEMDIAIAADQVQQGTDIAIRRIEHSWAGLRSFAPDGHPVVGYDDAAPGFFWLAGQGGFGLQTSPALSRAAKALVYGLDWPSDLAGMGITPADIGLARLKR